jgi:hypothetical protein
MGLCGIAKNGGLHISNATGFIRGDTTNGGVHVELSGTQWNGSGRIQTLHQEE